VLGLDIDDGEDSEPPPAVIKPEAKKLVIFLSDNPQPSKVADVEPIIQREVKKAVAKQFGLLYI
jgi:hypothetical protein